MTVVRHGGDRIDSGQALLNDESSSVLEPALTTDRAGATSSDCRIFKHSAEKGVEWDLRRTSDAYAVSRHKEGVLIHCVSALENS